MVHTLHIFTHLYSQLSSNLGYHFATEEAEAQK